MGVDDVHGVDLALLVLLVVLDDAQAVYPEKSAADLPAETD